MSTLFWKWARSSRIKLCAVLLVSDCLLPPWTVACQASLSMGYSRREYWNRSPCLPPGDLPNPRIQHRSSALQVDSSLTGPPGKPKNSGVGSLSFLQGIFLIQKSNRGLLHCRWLVYQLRYQGSSYILEYDWGIRIHGCDRIIKYLPFQTN